ncbi:hypothetical protein V5O48_008714 [Marasmius crinis-equi]|uniref:F-box domain-containing protein n=1 Tax=Marasmius crinis-equi TaxID=585013 RepID=A0ABR3FD52_9AGAR
MKPRTISKLPTELLLQVFEDVVEMAHSPSTPFSGPYALSAVCWNWRYLLACCPQLWTNIVIRHDPLIHPIQYKALKGRLQYALLRSENHPLSITLAHSSPLLDTVLIAATRWRLANLTITGVEAAGLENYSFPLLQKCTVNLCSQDSLGSHTINAPALKHVAIQIPSPFNPLIFPWQQITHLELELAFTDPLSRIIPPIPPPPVQSNPDRYPLPNLTYLHVNNYPEALEGLLTPQLRHVVLTTDRMIDTLANSEWIYNRVISLIIDSKCTIEIVEFRVPRYGVKLSNASVNSLLEWTPNVRELRFSVYDMVSLLSLDWWSIGNLPALQAVEALTIRVSKTVSNDPLVRSLTPMVSRDVIDEEDLARVLGTPQAQWEKFVIQNDAFLHIIREKLVSANLKVLNLNWDSSVYRDWYHTPRISRRLRDIEGWIERVTIPGVNFKEKLPVTITFPN